MAKVKKKNGIGIQGNPHFVLLHSVKPVRAPCVDLFTYKKNPTREETLPSLSSSFRRPTSIGLVRSSL